MRQPFLEHPGGGTRSSTGITCNGESVNMPTITAASNTSQPLSFSNHHQPSYHVGGGGDSLGISHPEESNHMLKGGDGRVPASATALHPTAQQIHLDQHRPSSLPLGIENKMECEGTSSHSSSLSQDDTLMFHQLANLRDQDESDSASPANTTSSASESGGSKGFKKRAWTSTEDDTLRDLVEQHGAKDWNNISSQLPHRSAKQCCERWHNYLKPDIRKDAWCAPEDQIILDYHHAFCNKWSKIAEFLPGRTGNAVKNRYYCLMRRDRKNAGSAGAARGGGQGGASLNHTRGGDGSSGGGGGGNGAGGETLIHQWVRPPLSPPHVQQQQQQQQQQLLQQPQPHMQQQQLLQQLQQQGIHSHLPGQHLPPGHSLPLGLPIIASTGDVQGNIHTQLNVTSTCIPGSQQHQQHLQQRQPQHPQHQHQHYTHSLQCSPTEDPTEVPPWGPSWVPAATTSGQQQQQQQQQQFSSSNSGSSGSSCGGGLGAGGQGGGLNAMCLGGSASGHMNQGGGGGGMGGGGVGKGGSGAIFTHDAYPHHSGTPTEFRFTAAGAHRPTIHLGGGGGVHQQQQQQEHLLQFIASSTSSHANYGGGRESERGNVVSVDNSSNRSSNHKGREKAGSPLRDERGMK